MVAKSATTHRAGIRGDAQASIESVSTTSQSKGHAASTSSRMRSQQGMRKSSRKKEQASKVPYPDPASRSSKKSHKSMAAASKGTTSKTRAKSVATKSKPTTGAGKAQPPNKMRAEDKSIVAEKASSKSSTIKASTCRPSSSISSEKRKDVECKTSDGEKASTKASQQKPSSPMASKKTAASSSQEPERSGSSTSTKKTNASTEKSSGTTIKSRGSAVRSTKAVPTITSAKSKSTRTKISNKAPAPSSTGHESRSSTRKHKNKSQNRFEEVDEEDKEVESDNFEEDVRNIAEANTDARTEAALEFAGEEEHSSRSRSSRPSSSRPPPDRSFKHTRHSRSRATSSHRRPGAKAAKSKITSTSKRSGSGRRSSSHQESYTHDDSTVSTFETRPLPEITLSNVQCDQMLSDTDYELGKYAFRPLGLADVRCACGDFSHQRSYSEPPSSARNAPEPSLPGLQSIRHRPDCSSYHPHYFHAGASSPPTSGGNPRGTHCTEHESTEYAPTAFAIDDEKTAAISALTMPPLPANSPIPSGEDGACREPNVDQIALQGMFEQYDEFVANSKVAANNIVHEMQGMSLEKVKQKAERLGNTVTTLFRSSPSTGSNLADNKWRDGLSYTHRNQVTIMTPSEEAQDDWESGHVQLRFTDSHEHLTESCEPRNPYARLDAVEVVDDSPLKTFLPSVAEEEEDIAEESAYTDDRIGIASFNLA